MERTKIRIYGFNGKTVVKTTWYYNDQVDDDRLDAVARFWKTAYGCTQVFAMMDSRELHDFWLAYIKGSNLHNGMAEFIKLEFYDYVQSGDMELAADD